jgi:hypothetical protein
MGLQQALRHQIVHERAYLIPNSLFIDIELEQHLLLRLLKIMTSLEQLPEASAGSIELVDPVRP